ncbi:restriction endonuclease subunit S [Enterococcus durans]|uniref:restriction endonuclease subunit S n=1 Tax=Enterococcus durans TaxID=53345 RepID=UPI001D16C3BC|nr:restriction endonuclease subunit S [Enterococcus durans]
MISVMDILDEQPIKYEYIRNSVQVDAKIESKNKIEYGDLVFVRSSEVPEEVGWAKAYLEEEYALYSGFSIRGKKINEFNPYFVELTLNSINRKQIERKAGGSTRFNVSQTILNSLELLMPKIEEQNKIDKFFKQLDDTIALHQDKLNKLKQLKKGFLQVLFANETTIPKIRFANFTEEWEQRKLEKLTDFFSGLTYSPENVQNDGTFVLRSSNVKNNAIISADNVYVSNEVANSEQVQVGDVIVVVRNGSRALIGKHASIKHEMPNTVIGAFMTGLRSPAPKFLNALLDTQQFNLEIQKNLGATINQITTGEFKKMQFKVPTNEDEKAKIGSFFQQIDNTIAFHQKKISSIKQLKKTFLQLMFI